MTEDKMYNVQFQLSHEHIKINAIQDFHKLLKFYENLHFLNFLKMLTF